jgi:tetratricopeptide (TPR) repeat protein/SAM-dependent methyltransferase
MGNNQMGDEQKAVRDGRDAIERAVEAHRAGRLQEAKDLYEDVLRSQPSHGDANHNLGVVHLQLGNAKEALPYLNAAWQASPQQGQYWLSYIDALIRAGDSKPAQQLLEQGRERGLQGQEFDRLEQQLLQALSVPNSAQIYFKTAISLESQGKFNDAILNLQLAITINVNFPQAHCLLGRVYRSLGQLELARDNFTIAINLQPNLAEAHYLLSILFKDIGNLVDARIHITKALKLRSNYFEAYIAIAIIDGLENKFAYALAHIEAALRIDESIEAKALFVEYITKIKFTTPSPFTLSLLLRAVVETWSRPNFISNTIASIVLLDADTNDIKNLITHNNLSELKPKFIDNSYIFKILNSNKLFIALISSGPISIYEMELFLTKLRTFLLEALADLIELNDNSNLFIIFPAALATQCYLNEYVFSIEDFEYSKILFLRDKISHCLQYDIEINPTTLLVVASYIPLLSIPYAERLGQRVWQEDVARLINLQVTNPSLVNITKAAIPILTTVEDEVSMLVRSQYEESPYPVWKDTSVGSQPKFAIDFLHKMFPLSNFVYSKDLLSPDILVAGCGTGQQAIEVALKFKDSKVLAIDISIASLAFAKSKAIEMGINSVDFGCADILKLYEINKKFDIIEATGVLHHMKDPWIGWDALLKILKPGGFMRIGLYSQIARTEIRNFRHELISKSIPSNTDEIRKLRKKLLNNSENYANIINSSDFFNTSGCRDLLCHVHEFNLSLSEINDYLIKNNLKFLGFELNSQILKLYKIKYPNDNDSTNLNFWNEFEFNNPSTFRGMYQFWIQKL